MSSGSTAAGTLSVEATPPENASSWNDFVDRHPRASYCHRFEWSRIVEQAYGRSCTNLLARRGREVVGVLPLVWMPGRIGGRRLVSMPYLDLGGPLAVESAVERALIHAALGQGQSLGARSIELREDAGSDAEPPEFGRFRFVLDLPNDSESLWKSLDSKVRNQIRKARKSGLSTARAEPDRLPRFYEVFSRNMRDLGSPVHSFRFLREIFRRFGDRAHLFLTTDGSGRTLAGAVGISFGGTLTVPWASALRSARHLCPNHSLYWAVLESAVEAGASSFDFGRSSTGTGTYRFKKQWGATPVPLAWRQVDRDGSRPERLPSRSRVERLMVGVWKLLPLSVANRLGPRIRGRLAQ